jgi:hypothetical protein
VGSHAAKRNKTQRGLAYLAIAGGALALSIGGVFATNSITINTNNAIEFGQGIATTGSCDAALSATISQTYNVDTDIFEASQIVISGVDDSGCAGKNVHVSLIGDEATVCGVDGTNDNVFAIASTMTSLTLNIAAGCDAATINKVAITTS